MGYWNDSTAERDSSTEFWLRKLCAYTGDRLAIESRISLLPKRSQSPRQGKQTKPYRLDGGYQYGTSTAWSIGWWSWSRVIIKHHSHHSDHHCTYLIINYISDVGGGLTTCAMVEASWCCTRLPSPTTMKLGEQTTAATYYRLAHHSRLALDAVYTVAFNNLC